MSDNKGVVSDELVQLRLPREREWRSLAEWRAHERAGGEGAATPEFPPGADEPPALSRRGFLELLGAGVALASLDGCGRKAPEKILPYSVRPRDARPGVPCFYATSMLLDGFATGLIVESHEGRPTKVEGNPAHPASLGATSLYHQASVLDVYDPARAAEPRRGRSPITWHAVFDFLRRPRDDRGTGLRVVLEPTSSPSVHAQLARVRAAWPRAKVTYHSPAPAIANTTAGAALAFGRALLPQYDVRAAQTIVLLDCDLLNALPFSLRWAREWAAGRRGPAPQNRLYVIEPMLTPSGMVADHRLRRRAGEVARVALAIAAALPDVPAEFKSAPAAGEDATFARAVARDLAARPRGTTLIVAGERQPPAVHALAYALNAALGNVGRTVSFTESPVPLDGDQDLAALTAELNSGSVDTLVLIDNNPLYNAPADLDFAKAAAHAADRFYLGHYEDETAQACNWFAPCAHWLESWGDGRAWDGTLSLQQPLIRPLKDGKSPLEVLAALAGTRDPDGHALTQATHAGAFDWDSALVRGVVDGTALPKITANVQSTSRIADALRALPRYSDPNSIEINFAPSPTLHDGRFANNAWLLEQPEPATKLSWGNAVLISPQTAKHFDLSDQDLVEVRVGGRSVRGPIFIAPGHADGACTLWLGWGRGVLPLSRHGFDAYPLRTSKALNVASGELRPMPGVEELATTQRHWDLHGRPIALSTTAAQYRRHPNFTEDTKGPQPSLLPLRHYEGLQWAMSIDLSICTGCSACMIACQSENNLPVVGKPQVLKSREMHWLRIDTYYRGSPDDPQVVNQPMMCQHCETAPCEYVCPVNATVHSPDGLNEMVYNRCVGTRFCSNNCPYKVRRFNWFNWHNRVAANRGPVELQRNPEVTVRDRGVMEKCTYCVQRIRTAEIRAEVERRELAPNEVVTACQQACPTRAIEFGSLSHQDTEMVRRRAEPRSYSVLNEQGTRPRTMYLARIENPNPELE